jgi:hypothetical protein
MLCFWITPGRNCLSRNPAPKEVFEAAQSSSGINRSSSVGLIVLFHRL